MKTEKPKLTVREFFDPTNRKHLHAYRHYMKTGAWPAKFLPKNVQIAQGLEHLDLLGVRTKIISYWMSERFGGN